MLEVRRVNAFYGDSQVLFDMNLAVSSGEVVTLLGRNGMGKTTTVRTIMGIVRTRSGTITLNGTRIDHLPSHAIARAGIGLVPEGRQIFPNLSVRENLIATARTPSRGGPGWTFERVIELFPAVGTRLASAGNQLSGGEQQMLAIGRALLTNPLLMILDEATEGLAPLVRQEIWACLGSLKKAGQAVLVIDKNVEMLAGLADLHHIVEKGRVVWKGTSAELRADRSLQLRYLGV